MFENFTDDIRVVDIKITSASGEYKTIVSQVVNLQIQEDVTSPYVFAEITLNDAIGLLQGLPIKGEETIELEFQTPVLVDATLKYKFSVYAVSHLSSGIKNDMNMYQLKCVSEELMTNASRFISKGYKDTFTAIVVDIIRKELGSKKPFDGGDGTLGVQDWVIPSQKPFQAIDMIRRRAASAAHAYSPMLFFETQDGYVFNDMASLYRKGADQDKYSITYNFTNATVDESIRNGVITAFNAPEKRDTFEQVNNGAFNNKVTTYDIITKTLKTYDFNYQDKQSTFFKDKTTTHSDAFISKFSGNAARTYLLPIDSTKPDHFVDRIGDKQAYTSVMFQNLTRARLVGGKNNRLLRAGGVVFLSFPAEMASYKNPNGKDERDTQNSGFYFLKRVVHELSLVTSPITYSASCELVAGAPMEKL